MLIIKTAIEEDFPIEPFFEREQVTFFDIETTGLSAYSAMIYLIGLMYYREGKWMVEQIFAERREEEAEILIHFLEQVKNFSTVLSFNGDHFDIPFVLQRMRRYGIEARMDFASFDLYKFARAHRSYLPTENLKLKSIEKFLGIDRQDSYNGGDCIRFYYDYLSYGDEEKKRIILAHNFYDIKNMLPLLRLLKLSKEKNCFEIEGIEYEMTDCEICTDHLAIEGKLKGRTKDLALYENRYSLLREGEHFRLVLEVHRGKINGTNVHFIDKRDYPELEWTGILSEHAIPDALVEISFNSKLLKDRILLIVRRFFEGK